MLSESKISFWRTEDDSADRLRKRILLGLAQGAFNEQGARTRLRSGLRIFFERGQQSLGIGDGRQAGASPAYESPYFRVFRAGNIQQHLSQCRRNAAGDEAEGRDAHHGLVYAEAGYGGRISAARPRA